MIENNKRKYFIEQNEKDFLRNLDTNCINKIFENIKIPIFFNSDTIARLQKLLLLEMHYLTDALHFYLTVQKHGFLISVGKIFKL